jgi:hypothetical protein
LIENAVPIGNEAADRAHPLDESADRRYKGAAKPREDGELGFGPHL